MMSFNGVFTALVTPFTADGARVDVERIDALVQRQAEGGVAGVVPCGTTGEAPTLDEAEHGRVVERVIETARRSGLRVIAGAGSNCTAHAVALHRLAAGLGADAALHVCPYYNKPSQEGLYRHFSAIADAADLPIVLYDIPGRTGVALAFETIQRLAAHPNVVAIKDATGGTGAAMRVLAGTDLAVLSGDDPLTLPMLLLGAHGVVSVLSNVLPGEVAAMCAAAAAGDVPTARAIHAALLPLAVGLLGLDGNPVPVKAALAQMQLDSGAVRLPLAPATAHVRERIAELLAPWREVADRPAAPRPAAATVAT